jgi:hypothetical protein
MNDIYILKHKIFITWNNYLKCHNYEIITWNNYWSWMIYFVTWNNYLKFHHITDGHTDGLSPSAFHKSSKIITWNATQSPTAVSPSAFHKEFENNYLKCHPITNGHTDEFKSVSKLSAGQFYRQNYRRTARISKGCALNAPLTVSSCRRNYRQTTKNMEGH